MLKLQHCFDVSASLSIFRECNKTRRTHISTENFRINKFVGSCFPVGKKWPGCLRETRQLALQRGTKMDKMTDVNEETCTAAMLPLLQCITKRLDEATGSAIRTTTVNYA
jgi:hypothetical protein